MTKHKWEESAEGLKYILSAPFLNGEMAKVPGKEVKQTLGWQMEQLIAYISSLLSHQLEELEEEVGDKRRKINPEMETNQDYGYNQALSDITSLINSKKG